MGVINDTSLAIASADENLPLIGYDNVITPSSVSADSNHPDHPASNLGNPATHLRWQADDSDSPITAQATVTATIGTADPINYLGLAKHNLGSGAVPITVEKNAGAGWSTLFSQRTLDGDSPVIFRFVSQVLTGLRIVLGVGTENPRIAVMYAGTLLTMQRRIYVGQTPLPHGRKSKATNSRSESGNYLGRIVTQEVQQTKVPLSLITPAFYRSDLDPFLDAAKDTPFFFAWRPGDYPAETGYAWLTNDPEPVNQGPSGLVALNLEMTGIVA